MTGVRRLAIGVGVALAAASLSLWAAPPRQPAFPHAEHARLFPLCAGCHEGVPAGDSSAFYPEPGLCARCHDGAARPRVEWTGPTDEPDNLAFSHPEHAAEAGADLECASCHVPEGAPRMAVEGVVEQQCFSCHAHRAESHYQDADCATCHVPLAETRFSAARVAALPVPATHGRPEFLTALHGELVEAEPARCATCHTRELCTSCHVAGPVGDLAQTPRADTLPRITRAILSIPPAGPGLQLPAFEARYPVPPSHLAASWVESHGAGASVSACGTCHTRESCATCHGVAPPVVVARLPSRERVVAPGVVVAGVRPPPSHASPGFLLEHGALADLRPQNCATCHGAPRFCESCHASFPLGLGPPGDPDAPLPARALPPGIVLPEGHPARTAAPGGRPGGEIVGPVRVPALVRGDAASPVAAAAAAGFHPADFVSRHAAAAYGRRLECGTCHNTQVFCRDCHEQVGFEPQGRLGQGFHDAQPLWLLRHGQAARQSLESCATCHAQRDCMQCHSQLGAFRISPHGPDFDATRAFERNPVICRACHLGDPLVRRRP